MKDERRPRAHKVAMEKEGFYAGEWSGVEIMERENGMENPRFDRANGELAGIY